MKGPTDIICTSDLNLLDFTSILINIGKLALKLHIANNAVNAAKCAYYDAINKFENENGHVSGRINPREQQYAALITATKAEYAGYQAAKRFSYNIHRRLRTACRNAHMIAPNRRDTLYPPDEAEGVKLGANP